MARDRRAISMGVESAPAILPVRIHARLDQDFAANVQIVTCHAMQGLCSHRYQHCTSLPPHPPVLA